MCKIVFQMYLLLYRIPQQHVYKKKKEYITTTAIGDSGVSFPRFVPNDCYLSSRRSVCVCVQVTCCASRIVGMVFPFLLLSKLIRRHTTIIHIDCQKVFTHVRIFFCFFFGLKISNQTNLNVGDGRIPRQILFPKKLTRAFE